MESQPGRYLPINRDERQALEAMKQGIQHLQDGEEDEAITCFTEAIRLDPDCSRAYRLRGRVHEKTGAWAQSERDVAKARRIEAMQT